MIPMDLIQAFILGIIQGVTEYIPVSSSAHLVVVPWLLGWPDAPFAFDVLVQWGTLVGVFFFFWPDIWMVTRGVLQALLQGKPLATFEAKLGWLVLLATIPAVVLGLMFKDFFEAAFASPVAAGALLSLTALLLITAERFGSRQYDLEKMSWLDALIVGLWQAVAILPGVSRSGATIGGAMLRGFNRVAAARFSFLMSVPVLIGAGLVALKDIVEVGATAGEVPAIIVGFIAAAISGYTCIRWLLRYLQHHSLYIFAVYCFGFSLLTILVWLMRQ
jgi:undecaprenyl-diphosphatase